MKFPSRSLRRLILASTACSLLSYHLPGYKHSNAQTVMPVPIQSSPIVLDRNHRFVWVVNPDNNSVSVVDVRQNANVKFAEIPVGQEPQSVTISTDDQTAYVANALSGTVSVIDISNNTVTTTIPDTAVSDGSGTPIPTSRRNRRIPRNLSTR